MAAFVAGALFAAQTATFVHFVRVRHVSCGDHGLLLDVAVTAGTPRTAPRADTAVVSSRSDDAGHEHDHCAGCLLSPSSGGAPVLAPIDGAVCRGDEASVAARGRAPVATRRYALAPKQSPPLS